jgi:UDP-glucose 4-epimerase
MVLDDLSGGSRENLAGFDSVEIVEGSITDVALVRQCVKRCDYVLHQAALGSVPRSVKEPRLYHEVNTVGTLTLLEQCAAAGVKRLLFAASSSAYGLNPVPWREDMPVLPRSPYAATKVAGEALLRSWSASYGLDTASLRYFNIFGPRQNANSAYAAVIAAFARSLLEGQRPVIFGDGEQSRDFTYVDNAVHANLLALSHPKPLQGGVFNVGCGGNVSVNQLAQTIAGMLGRPELAPVYESERAGDIKHSYAELSKSKRVLDYSPIVSFAEGMERTLQWYRRNLH